jgi:hypothetical protein
VTASNALRIKERVVDFQEMALELRARDHVSMR